MTQRRRTWTSLAPKPRPIHELRTLDDLKEFDTKELDTARREFLRSIRPPEQIYFGADSPDELRFHGIDPSSSRDWASAVLLAKETSMNRSDIESAAVPRTDVLSVWHTPEIAALNGRRKAYEFKKKHGIGMEALLQSDALAGFDSLEAGLRALDAHEFVEVEDSAKLWDTINLGREAGPLWGVLDDHNNNPDAYHEPGVWQGRTYGEDGRNRQLAGVFRSQIEEFDDLFEPDGIGLLNENRPDEDYEELVARVWPTARRRGLELVVTAPGRFPAGTTKGAHLALNRSWSLERTREIVDEALEFGRSFDELWIGRGSAWSRHEARQMMIAIGRSFDLRRPIVSIFIGDEGFPRVGRRWAGKMIQTFAFSGGGFTTYGELLDAFLGKFIVDGPPPKDLEALIAGQDRNLDRWERLSAEFRAMDGKRLLKEAVSPGNHLDVRTTEAGENRDGAVAEFMEAQIKLNRELLKLL